MEKEDRICHGVLNRALFRVIIIVFVECFGCGLCCTITFLCVHMRTHALISDFDGIYDCSYSHMSRNDVVPGMVELFSDMFLSKQMLFFSV